ncbi:MAG TPA: hypothetical protein VFV38_17495 [Ktedonobacteraceae bacterium]|nr:hypothetical protein [Ktedonobacteraceae bacterium]
MSLQDFIHTTGLTRVSAEIEQGAFPSVRLRVHTTDEMHLSNTVETFAVARLRSSFS